MYKDGLSAADLRALFIYNSEEGSLYWRASGKGRDLNKRALLCSPCNVMLGTAKDSVELLKKGIDYLNEHNTIPR